MKEGNAGSDAVLPTGLAGNDAKASDGKEVAGSGVFTGSRTGTGTGLRGLSATLLPPTGLLALARDLTRNGA